MSYLAVTGALVMMVFGGIGVDMIHTELKRTKVQNALDRAVLAAADLENTMDPTFTVNDYMRAMGMEDALGGVTVSDSLTERTVTANASIRMPSNFLSLVGVDTLQAAGLAEASESRNKVEISLVLDVSGSMANNNKLTNLKTAANEFFDTVLTGANQDRVSISLVPYSEHVNAGPAITQNLNVNWDHSYSHCLELPDSVFSSTALNSAITYDQVQHYNWNYYGNNDLNAPVCPEHSYERITPFSQDAAALKAQINALQPRAGTAIFAGMKWGTALLDPSSQGLNSNLIATGNADPAFAGRPSAYGDGETIKTVVLMTDGQHDFSNRIRSDYYNSPEWVDTWANNNLWYYLVNNVPSYEWGNYYEQRYNMAYGDSLLDSVCDAAKASGIVVWTISFEGQEHGESVMQNCASSPSHYFDVEGTEISEAFSSIARTITQLRLTQ
ncbi:pilus assembly protein TadG-related protein [uncultured Pelagimonas sp.]|uniref:pilus assembly protein TadG-related protein n=1 Tax=uncultured Pelagimonas sp. TaxID=1618102 RepID=UPI002618487B|nr:pilus assembly protein TadG-related protein [uncultured Pelagimonas sp.]